MIEINLDSQNRKKNKIVIDGEDICQKYQITGFNIKYEAEKVFPILSVDIWDEMKLISDGQEMIINKKCIGNNHIWIYKKEDKITTSSIDIADLINSVEYSNYSDSIPEQLYIEINLDKLKNHANIFNDYFQVGRKIEVFNNNNLQYSGIIKEIALFDVLHITAIMN
jgi:hypothetical protein